MAAGCQMRQRAHSARGAGYLLTIHGYVVVVVVVFFVCVCVVDAGRLGRNWTTFEDETGGRQPKPTKCRAHNLLQTDAMIFKDARHLMRILTVYTLTGRDEFPLQVERERERETCLSRTVDVH